MSGIILSEDKNTGIQRIWHKDPMTGKMYVENRQKVDDVLDDIKSRSEMDNGKWKGDMHKVARIPKVLFDKWYKELGSDPTLPENAAWLMARLNSPEYMHLRTKSGKI